MTKTAIITGITGQDGSYLSELLLDNNYTVIGLHRRNSVYNFERIEHLIKSAPRFHLDECDLTDPSAMSRIIREYEPDEFYNLAAQSHVGTSFKQPTTTFEIDTIGVINILEGIKYHSPATRFYQASTSEMYGRSYDTDSNGDPYQDENTVLLPQSPYGVAKLASHRLVQIYREAYGMFACSGILFNHESPRRGENFVTRKITKYIGQLINNKTSSTLKLGNLTAKRDWGHAKDYVRAMWLMLQQDIADDFVIATGTTHTVHDFLVSTFQKVGLDYTQYVEIDENLYRPAEVDVLKGLSTKAKNKLGWQPEYSFESLVEDMVDHDCRIHTNV
jgi:GDPmannose 4,6-dehydratase